MSIARTWIPNQHGAWAMLITPVVVGALAGTPSLWHIALLLCWLAAFCLNFYIQLAVKSRRPRRYQRQLALYGILTLSLGIGLVVHDPDVLRMLAFAVPAFIVNVVFVLQRNERAWLNDVVGIALGGIVGYGAFLIGSDHVAPAAATHAAIALALVSAYFIGTVCYVKTMIRERGNQRWLWISYLWHAAFIVAWVALGSWPGAITAVWLIARAIGMPQRGGSPKLVGLLEIPATIAVALAALTH